MTHPHHRNRRSLPLVALAGLSFLLLVSCDDGTGPADTPASTFVVIRLDPVTELPIVNRDTAAAYGGASVLWLSPHGPDTTWLVRLEGETPFVGGQMEFESADQDAGIPVGGVVRRSATPGSVYSYVVKIIVNGGADTLGLDPEIIIREPPSHD